MWKCLRDVFQSVPELNAQVLDIAPLALLHWLPRKVNVIHCQLSLIEQPLHHKHWT